MSHVLNRVTGLIRRLIPQGADLMNREYDYIIIGAGSAGCVLVHELSSASEKPQHVKIRIGGLFHIASETTHHSNNARAIKKSSRKKTYKQTRRFRWCVMSMGICVRSTDRPRLHDPEFLFPLHSIEPSSFPRSSFRHWTNIRQHHPFVPVSPRPTAATSRVPLISPSKNNHQPSPLISLSSFLFFAQTITNYNYSLVFFFYSIFSVISICYSCTPFDTIYNLLERCLLRLIT